MRMFMDAILFLLITYILVTGIGLLIGHVTGITPNMTMGL